MGGQPFKMAEVAPACCNHQSAFFLYDSYWTADRGVFRYLFHPTGRVLNFLTPQSRVLKNVRICVFHPKIYMFFQQNRQNLSSVQGSLMRNPTFLTDNKHGSHKSRVLISNINTPLASMSTLPYLLTFLPSTLLKSSTQTCLQTHSRP